MTAQGTTVPSINGTVKFITTCQWCQGPIAVDMLEPAALEAYLAGESTAADLFPRLSPSELEVLVSGTHAACWEAMFPPEDEDASLCAECGEEAEKACATCDRPLCDDHARTTSVPGDTFCCTGQGCQPVPGA